VDRTALRTICLRISYAISLSLSLSLSLNCCTCTNIQKQTRATHQLPNILLQSRINLSLTYVVSSVVHAHNSLHTTSLLRARAKSGSSLTIHMGLSRRWQGRDEPHHYVTTTTTAPAAVAGETEGEEVEGVLAGSRGVPGTGQSPSSGGRENRDFTMLSPAIG
jgi:hypothetical protein